MGLCCSSKENTNKQKPINQSFIPIAKTKQSVTNNSIPESKNDTKNLNNYTSDIQTHTSFFNLQKDKVEIIAEENLEKPLEFIIRIFNFKTSSIVLNDKLFYFIELIVIDKSNSIPDDLLSKSENNTENTKNIFSSVVKGEHNKFDLDKATVVSKQFLNLNDPYIKIVSFYLISFL